MYLKTINIDNLKKRNNVVSTEYCKDLSLKTVNNECLVNIKDKVRAKSLRNSPLPLRKVLKFRSPSKTPEIPTEKFSNPYNIRFVKLEEIRKKITSKFFNTNSDLPKMDYQANPKQQNQRKITPEKQMNHFFITKSNLNYSSKLLKDQKGSNKVLEKFNLNSPFIAYFYTKNSPKLSPHPKLNQNKLP